MLYWTIEVENFEDINSTFYFENYEIARKNFEVLCEKNKSQDEFVRHGEHRASWFDSNYNADSTYVALVENELPTIHSEIIF